MKMKLKSSILAGLCTLSMLVGNSSLKDIAKPYLGEYECNQAIYGDKTYLEDFEYIKIELRSDNTYILTSKDKKTGKKMQMEGEYSYDEKRKEITFQLGNKEFIKRKFTLKDGVLLMVTTIGSKVLQMEFRQK